MISLPFATLFILLVVASAVGFLGGMLTLVSVALLAGHVSIKKAIGA